MFSSLLYSEDKFSWLPVVLLRQRFLRDLIEQHHTGGNGSWKDCLPKAIAGTKITHTGSSMSLLWKTGLLFSCSTFCHLLYPSFHPVFCTLASLLSPLHLSLCFHLLFLYTLNTRQSVLTRFFSLIPWETSIAFLFPSQRVFFPSTGASQPAASFPLLQLSKKLIAPDWVPDWTQLSIPPLDILGGCCHTPHSIAQFLSLVAVAGRVGIESAKQPSIYHNCIFYPLKNIGFFLRKTNLFGRYFWHLWGSAVWYFSCQPIWTISGGCGGLEVIGSCQSLAVHCQCFS